MVTLFMGPSACDFFGRCHNQILCRFGDFVDVNEYVINVEFVSEHGRLTRQIHFLHLYIRDLNGFDTDTYVMLCQEYLNSVLNISSGVTPWSLHFILCILIITHQPHVGDTYEWARQRSDKI